jgi:hypothetical protein
MKPDYQLPPEDHSQQTLPGMGPQVGERYRNIYSGYLGTILKVQPGRRTWITLRKNDAEHQVTLEDLRTYWRPYDGIGAIG